MLFAILQKYDFSSKSQPLITDNSQVMGCLRYCKSTIFQANHNRCCLEVVHDRVVCDTAKVRFFKQITTNLGVYLVNEELFAILQKYDFSSKSQHIIYHVIRLECCLRYCKSTIFQANHNTSVLETRLSEVVCDTAKVRFFKQITTFTLTYDNESVLFAILQKYDFSSKSQP